MNLMSSIAKTLVGSTIAMVMRGAGLVDREDVVLAGDVGRDHLDDGVVDLEAAEVDRRDAELLGEALGDVFLGDEAELDERLAELAAGLLLNAQGFLELILRDQAGLWSSNSPRRTLIPVLWAPEESIRRGWTNYQKPRKLEVFAADGSVSPAR